MPAAGSAMTQNSENKTPLDLHIDGLIAEGESTNFGSRTQERRQKARIMEPFPARIWGVDSGDLPFNADAVVDNMSSTGLYVKTPITVGAGKEVKLIVHLLNGPVSGVTASVQGQVLRSERQADGKYGLAITISKHRFL